MRPWFIDIGVFFLLIVAVVVGAPLMLGTVGGMLAPPQPTFVTRQDVIRDRAKEVIPQCVQETLRNKSVRSEFAEPFCACYAPRAVSNGLNSFVSDLQQSYNRRDQSACEEQTIQSLMKRGDLAAQFDRISAEICQEGAQAVPAKNESQRANFCKCFSLALNEAPYWMARVVFLGARVKSSPFLTIRARECGADMPAPGNGWKIATDNNGMRRAALDVPTHPAISELYFQCGADKKLTLGRAPRFGGDIKNADKIYFDLGPDEDLNIEFKNGIVKGRMAERLYFYFLEEAAAVSDNGMKKENYAAPIYNYGDSKTYPTHIGDVELAIGSHVKPCLPGNSVAWNTPASDEPLSHAPDRWKRHPRVAVYDMQDREGPEEGAVQALSFQCKPEGLITLYGSAIDEISRELSKKAKQEESQKTTFTLKAAKGENVEIASTCGNAEGGQACWISPKVAQMQTLVAANEVTVLHAGKELIRFPFGNVAAIREMLGSCTFVDSQEAPTKAPTKESANVPISLVTPAPKVGQVATLSSSLNVRMSPAPDGQKVGELPAGTRIKVTRAANEEWSEIDVGGRVVGFVKNSALAKNSSASPVTVPLVQTPLVPVVKVGMAYTLSDTLNVRGTPSTEGQKLGELPKGTRIKVTRQASEEWSEVELNGRVVGFVKNTALLRSAGGSSNQSDAIAVQKDDCKAKIGKMEADDRAKFDRERAALSKEAEGPGGVSDASVCMVARAYTARAEAILAAVRQCNAPEYGAAYQAKKKETIEGGKRIIIANCR